MAGEQDKRWQANKIKDGRRTKLRNRKLLPDMVRDDLRGDLLSGVYAPGDKVPPEPTLARTYGVSRVTLREAVRGLVEEGYLSRQHGLGTYVTEKPKLKNNLDVNFGVTDLICSMGMVPGNKDVCIREEAVSERVARALALEEDQRVVRLERVRTADGEPIVYSVDYLPMALLVDGIESLRNLSGSVYEFLSDLGHPVHHGVANLKPLVDGGDIATKLGLGPGELLLHIAQVDYREEGQPLLFSLEWHRSDLLQVTVYRRGPTFLTEGPSWIEEEEV